MIVTQVPIFSAAANEKEKHLHVSFPNAISINECFSIVLQRANLTKLFGYATYAETE
jgi:hypothetical protein